MVLKCESGIREGKPQVEEYGLDVLEASAEGVLSGLGPVAAGLGRLAVEARGAVTLDDLEVLVTVRGRELLRDLMQMILDAQAGAEVRVAGVTGADGVTRCRAERGHVRVVVTGLGPVRVSRIAYRAGVKGVRSLFPRDAVLGLPGSGYSHGLRRLVVRFARVVSFEQAGELVEAVTGVRVGKRQLEEITGGAAADVQGYYASGPGAAAPEEEPGGAEERGGPEEERGGPEEPEEPAVRLPLALSADGKGVAMRPGSRRKRTRAPEKRVRNFSGRAGTGEKKGHKRMAETACVFDVIPCPRTPEQVMASCHGSGKAEAGEKAQAGKKSKKKPAPEAIARRYRCDIAEDRSVSVRWLFDEADRRDPGRARDWIALADGDNHQIALIQAEAAARGVEVTVLIDLIHVIEYIWKAGWALHAPRDPAIETWTTTCVLDILHGRAAAVADRIAALAAASPPSGPEHARNIDRTIAYLRAKLPYLNYPEALEKGWPVATGVIEGACRHIVLDRMGITGARWTTSGAQAILWHRVISANHHDDTYWKYHLQQEHHRNHHSRYATRDNVILAA